MTFYGRRKSEDYQPFKFPILCIVITTQSNARQTAFNHGHKGKSYRLEVGSFLKTWRQIAVEP